MALTNTQHPDLPYLSLTKLNKSISNYEIWRSQILYQIQRQGLLGFINGINTPPPLTILIRADGRTSSKINPDCEVWRKTDMFLMEWLLSKLDDGIVDPTTVALKTSRDIWLELENKFNESFRKFSNTVKGGDDTIGIVIDQQYQRKVTREWDTYWPLYRAALEGDWLAAEQIFLDDPTAVIARIDATKSTALHVSVSAGEKAIDFMTNLLYLLQPGNDLISAKNEAGDTALSIAAAVGNLEAATLLVKKMSSLLYIPNNLGIYPVHTAAIYAQERVLWYLISVTKDHYCEKNPYAGSSGLSLLLSCIEAEYLVIATRLVEKYPYLATLKLSSSSALKSVVSKKFQFTDIERLNFLKEPRSKWPRKRTTQLQLVRLLCQKVRSLSISEAEHICWGAILLATTLDLHEIVEVIFEAFPRALHCSDPVSLQSVYHVAVENRSVNTLNLIYRRNGSRKHSFLNLSDINGNSMLHLAAKLAPSRKLKYISNAALQMQREMQWYKAVENDVHPHSSERLNHDGKSPKMIFTEEHTNMRQEAEKWFKSTSSSCMIVATLISTMMFAAAITVPGGTNSMTGFPLFSNNSMFVLFAISDAVSLLSSATSVLIFLDLMSSGYAQEDFHFHLPMRMMIGMSSLILSITFMVLSFSALLYLVFGKQHKWVLISVATTVFYMIYFFLKLQMPLLARMILQHSTFYSTKEKKHSPRRLQLLSY